MDCLTFPRWEGGQYVHLRHRSMDMTELLVQNMTCGHCVSAVTRAIRAVDPQAEVQVDLKSGRVRVSGASAAGELAQALDQAGYPAAQAESTAPAPAKKGCCCA
jgi:copper chaperone